MAMLRQCLLFLCFCACQIYGMPSLVDDYVKMFYEKILNEANVSSQCLGQIEEAVQGFTDGQEWAIRMVDASAKPQSGLLMGNLMHVGNYDECLQIDARTKNGRIRGKYCTILYTVREAPEVYYPDLGNLRYSYGICLPSGCNADELQTLMDAQEKHVQSQFLLKFFEDYCDSADKIEPFSSAAVAATAFFSAVLLIIIISTLYDIYVYQKIEDNRNEWLIAFSLYTNGKKMFSTKTGEENLNCLNGIRVISMMWIVLAHGYMTDAFVPLVNAFTFYEWTKKTENMVIPGAGMAVDTFFAVSGLLVVYVYLKATKRGVKLNLFVFYLHRYLRLTPALAALVLFYATLVIHIGHGPFWRVVYMYLQESCAERWWPTLLYIQNYNNPDEECIGQAWYLAVDTQLYFLSPLILIPIVRWPKQTIFGIILVGCASAAGAFAVTWQKNFGANFFNQEPDQNADYFVATHFRMTPWLVGAVFGYFIYQTRDRRIRLSKARVLLLWAFSFTVMAAAVFGQVDFMKYERNKVTTSIFNAFARPSWAFAVCVIIFMCVQGYGGIVNDFLSSSVFNVMVRINYSVYLLHQIVMVYFAAQKKSVDYIDNKSIFHHFWGDFVFTVVLSIIFSLAFESPIIAIEKLIFRKGSDRKSNSSSQQTLRTNLEVASVASNSKTDQLNVVVSN